MTTHDFKDTCSLLLYFFLFLFLFFFILIRTIEIRTVGGNKQDVKRRRHIYLLCMHF